MSKNEIKSVSFLKGILNFMGIVLIALMSTTIHLSLVNRDSINFIVLKVLLVLVLFYFMFTILVNLHKILNTIKDKNPFIDKNINRFRKIGAYVLILTFAEAIFNAPNKTGTLVIDIKPIFSLTLTSLVMIIFGCLSLVLAEIFSMALEIKNENDLTI